jgi:hypothetical protein
VELILGCLAVDRQIHHTPKGQFIISVSHSLSLDWELAATSRFKPNHGTKLEAGRYRNIELLSTLKPCEIEMFLRGGFAVKFKKEAVLLSIMTMTMFLA